MSSAGRPLPSRRQALTALGGAGLSVAAIAGGTGWVTGRQDRPSPLQPAFNGPRLTVSNWQADRGPQYYIAHRGSGDVYPEHTMPAYEAAVQWGASCIEVSVGSTSDGTLICLHDLTYNRTATATGATHDQPATILRGVGVRQPQLGPAWLREPLPAIPLLVDVLRRFGGQVILAIEAKRDADYPAVIAMVRRFGLQDSVIVKAYRTSKSIHRAQQDGFQVFGYLGAADANVEAITQLASVLRKDTDYLALPASTRDDRLVLLDESLIASAVATGHRLWAAAVHRRSEAAFYLRHGVSGIVTSSYGYVSTKAPVATADTWCYKTVASGELSRAPQGRFFAPSWTGTDELTLELHGTQHFMTLGQFCPIPTATGNYRIEFDARWNVLPLADDGAIAVAFGHGDDRYYQRALGSGSGYLALARRDGQLQLTAHRDGTPAELVIGQSDPAPAPAAGDWMHFRIDIDPARLSFAQLTDSASSTVEALDSAFRGGYLHIGRTSSDAVSSISFRRLQLT